MQYSLAPMTSPADHELYAAAVGRKAGYYLPYFRRAAERGYTPASWNWATFFFGVFWFLYRRQYRWAAGLTLAALLVGVLAGQVALAGYPGLGTTLQVVFLVAVLGVYAPLNANGFYYRWATARVQEAKAEFAFDRKRQLEYLALRGGPNLAAPLLVFVAIVLVTFLRPAGMLQ